MNAKKDAKDLLDDLFEDQFHPAHIKLTESIGLIPAMILQQHIFLQSKSNGGYVGARKIINKQFRISVRIQRPIEKVLISLGFLSIKQVDGSSFHLYAVHPEEIKKYIKLDYDTRFSIANQALKYKPNQDDDHCDRGSDNLSSGVVTNCHHLLNNNINTFSNKEKDKNQNSCSQNLKPTVSRLIPKKDDLVETRKKSKAFDKKNSLINRTNLVTGKSKPIPKQTKACIEYWNSFPELTTHKITEDNLSKTIKNASSLLGKLFNGTLLDVISIPKGFKDYKWFDRKVSAEEFFDIVDDFIYCIRSPEVRPISNGTKYNLVSFLKGSEYTNTQNGGMPSLMLNYCFGDYKTVIVDKNPQATLKIKELWNEYIGKFNDTPATEKAFILASNICVERFREKREEEEGWISAMNNYKPEGIIKQILINKKDWFRKEKKSPEIMGTGFFTNIIRRYDYDRYTGEKTI